MDNANPRDRAAYVPGLSALHALLGTFPLAYFAFAFITDVAYTQTYNLQWQLFSIWLITAGLIVGALSILSGLIEWFIMRRAATRGSGWHVILTIVAWFLALLNAFIHSRDGWTAVVPEGIILSGIVALLMLLSAVLGEVGWRGRHP